MSNPFAQPQAAQAQTAAVAERTYLRQVFAWMLLGLGLTTGVAIYLDSTADVLAYFDDHQAVWWLLFIAQLGMVLGLSAAINKLTPQAAALLFCLYAGLTGVTFSVLLAVYTTGSVVGAFAGATGVFGGMAIYGYTTHRDLTGLGAIMFGALIGLIVASIVYIFVGGGVFNLIIGCLGVIIFAGLTAYDMQKLKGYAAQGFGDEGTAQKLAIFGALALYLDFINIVISLLRIFGGRS